MRRIFRETQKKHYSNQITARGGDLLKSNKVSESMVDQSHSAMGFGHNGTYITTIRDPKESNQIKNWVNKVTNRLM